MKSATDRLLSQFKALADPTKTRIVALCAAAECSVSELTAVLRQSQPRVSQHLKQLCAADLLERFRDGHYVYYRVRTRGAGAATRRKLLALLPDEEPQFAADIEGLRGLRLHAADDAADEPDRLLHRALVELTVATPLGDLLDIGCGQGRLLKLLASRAQRVVGVDIDPRARQLARAEVLLAGLPNCTLRQGDMNALPFADEEFDTVILDDVMGDAGAPAQALNEAVRLTRPGGRILMLADTRDAGVERLRNDFSAWAADAGLRLAPPRAIPEKSPAWLLAVATRAERAAA